MAKRPAFLLTLLFCATALTGFAFAANPQQSPLPDLMPEHSSAITQYEMDIVLDPDGHTIRGTIHATWRNQTEAATSELLWHVYNNAWRDRDSVALVEARAYGSNGVPREWGDTEIIHTKVLQPDGSWSTLLNTWVAHENAPHDRTVMRTPLATPVAPGAEVTIEVKFVAVLPPAFRRMGYGSEGYLHAVQWYPKFGVFEKLDGEMVWSCEPYHYLSEFYADYGTYDVRLTLPAHYQNHMVSSGSIVGEPQIAGDQITYTLHADDIHDFAWTVDPEARVIHRPFVEKEWRDIEEEEKVAAALGRPVEAVRPKDTEMILLLQPEHGEYEEEYFTALARALYYFGLWYGTYPYETISCVDPAHDARATGGMEYPRLFTVGVRKGLHETHLSPEGTTVHEFGHQFWYGLVGNDEFRHAFLDEGFNTYSTSRILHKAWPSSRYYDSILGHEFTGKSPVDLPSYGADDVRALLTMQRLEIPDLGFMPALSYELRRRTSIEKWLAQVPSLSFFKEVPRSSRVWNRSVHQYDWAQPIEVPTFALLDGQLRRTNSYNRPAMTLFTLQELMGETRWIRLMRAWHEKMRFQHPQPSEWAKHLAEFGAGATVSGLDTSGVVQTVSFDWHDFWQQAYHGNDRMDFGVARLDNRPSVADSTAGQGDGAEPYEENIWDVRIAVRRYDGFRVPVEIRVHWSDDTITNHLWAGQDSVWKLERLRHDTKAMRVQVDPEHKLMLDRNRLNNERRVEPDHDRAWNYSVRALLWAQQVLHWYGGMG